HPDEGAPPYRTVCDCRKPRPGLLYRAAADHGLDLAQATLIGDKPSDLVAARAVGARSVLVLTGYGRGEWEHRRSTFTVPPDHVADDLCDGREWVPSRRCPGAGRRARSCSRCSAPPASRPTAS